MKKVKILHFAAENIFKKNELKHLAQIANIKAGLKIMTGQWSLVCDHRKALFNSHHNHQYLDITTTFTNFNCFTIFSKSIFAIF